MRWADDHGEPVATLPEPGRFVALALALVAGIAAGFLLALPAPDSRPYIGSQTVPALRCTEDEIIALMPGVVEPLCVHADAFTDAAID